ncbi:MAG: hypothetical protein RR214_05155, partial [Synergistaceae bacterium]
MWNAYGRRCSFFLKFPCGICRRRETCVVFAAALGSAKLLPCLLSERFAGLECELCRQKCGEDAA